MCGYHHYVHFRCSTFIYPSRWKYVSKCKSDETQRKKERKKEMEGASFFLLRYFKRVKGAGKCSLRRMSITIVMATCQRRRCKKGEMHSFVHVCVRICVAVRLYICCFRTVVIFFSCYYYSIPITCMHAYVYIYLYNVCTRTCTQILLPPLLPCPP